MYGNPYLSNQFNINNIDKQISDLQNLKEKYQNMQQQPQNVINIGNTSQNEFEARFINKTDEVENIPIQRKTAFISPENGYLKVKELNGDITTYELIPPKTEKDLKIEEQNLKIKELEAKLNEFSNATTNNEGKRQKSNDGKSNQE
jgi:hypothetical protein